MSLVGICLWPMSLGSKDQEQVEQEQEFISKNTTKRKKSIGAKKNACKRVSVEEDLKTMNKIADQKKVYAEEVYAERKTKNMGKRIADEEYT
ncbi:hypothetical protein Tco_0215253 [Tanacetum coccineum]